MLYPRTYRLTYNKKEINTILNATNKNEAIVMLQQTPGATGRMEEGKRRGIKTKDDNDYNKTY